jgi:hypothetical protein
MKPLQSYKLIALILATAASVQAAVVVDLEFVDGNGDSAFASRTPTTNTTTEYTIGWSDSAYLVDAASDGQNKAFYGAYSATSTDPITAPATIQSFDPTGTSNDRLIFQAGKSGSGDQAARILALWGSNDFLASANQFDASAGSSLTLGIHTFANNGGGMGARFVIRDGTQFYISSFSTVATASIDGTTSGLEWGSFDVNSFTSFDNSEADVGMSVTFSAQTFSNVTGVGFLTEIARPNTAGPVFAVNDFQAELVAVPEPSTYALLSGIFAIGLIMLRRRSRR